MHHVGLLVHSQDTEKFFSMVKAARALNSEPGSNPEYERAQVELIHDSVRWRASVEKDALYEFVFPNICEFELDGVPINLVCRDTATTWNGWAVPEPRPSELMRWLRENHRVMPEDEWWEMLPHIIGMYGGSDFYPEDDEPVSAFGLTWTKVRKDDK